MHLACLFIDPAALNATSMQSARIELHDRSLCDIRQVRSLLIRVNARGLDRAA
jgi:hypothetical protein